MPASEDPPAPAMDQDRGKFQPEKCEHDCADQKHGDNDHFRFLLLFRTEIAASLQTTAARFNKLEI